MAYPIIALWSHPRSMSTMLEKIMRSRGDLSCFHEPFMYYYYEHLNTKKMPHFQADPNQPTGYSEIWSMLQQRAQQTTVFFKDMSYYVYPTICSDSPCNKQLINTFLIRNPLKSIVSYHRLDSHVSLAEIGLEAQWKHYSNLVNNAGLRPVIIEAEAVQENPQSALQAFFAAIGIKHRPESLSWKNTANPKAWESVAEWHRQVASSTTVKTMQPASHAELEKQFEEYASTVGAPQLYEYLQHHLEFYNRLKAASR